MVGVFPLLEELEDVHQTQDRVQRESKFRSALVPSGCRDRKLTHSVSNLNTETHVSDSAHRMLGEVMFFKEPLLVKIHQKKYDTT